MAEIEFATLKTQIDRERDRLEGVLRDPSRGNEHQAAHALFQELGRLKRRVIEAELLSQNAAFDAISGALTSAAEQMRQNPLKSALDRVASLVGIALGEAGTPATPSELVGGFEGLREFIEDLLRGVREEVAELIERPAIEEAVAPRPPVVVAPPVTAEPVAPKPPAAAAPASGEQQRLIQAILEAGERFHVAAELLGAVAWIESRFENVKSRRSSATGPFQFLPSTWSGMVQRFGPQFGITDADISDVEAQATMAAIAFRGYREVLGKVMDEPSHACLYLAHLLGPGAAKACLEGDHSQPIDLPLRAFYRDKKQGESFAAKILAANPFLAPQGRPRTVAQVLDYVDELLMRGEARFQELAGSDTRPAFLGHAVDAAVPRWYQIALAEQGKGVKEIRGDRHNPDILKYIASTTIASNPTYRKDETAWCSAFVNWCLTQAGVQGTNSAKARDWHDGNWGRTVEPPVIGCLVVMWRERPDHPDRLGHVGFYAGEEGNRILVLGGNQAEEGSGVDTINVKAFPKQRVLSYRMPAGTPA
jgi:uncharacterized protein (TIGR02594 family)